MPIIIGCTKENNCKRDAFLKARQLDAERTGGLPYFNPILRHLRSNKICRHENIVLYDLMANENP